VRAAKGDRDAAESRMKSWTGPIAAGEFEEARLAHEWTLARLRALEP